MEDPEKTLMRLMKLHSVDRRDIALLDLYYEGEQPLSLLAPALHDELGGRISDVVINWPRMIADAYEHRLDVTFLRMPDVNDTRDNLLRDMLTENAWTRLQSEVHTEALACKRSYVIVGAGENHGDAPVVTAESPLQVFARHDPKTRKVVEAVKVWSDDDRVKWASVYQMGLRTTWRRERAGKWILDESDEHGLDSTLVTEFVNRGRVTRRGGVSEFQDIIPLANAANKMATDMMVSG
ncbi:MAG TPA: phage portal protein, partial [Ilumatobacteraceae bacterium]|nr:phage portal protein [Ilumatobacteraceae bacterium]